jgi:subtilisin family serine protease
MKKNILIVLGFFIGIVQFSFAQQSSKYWITFKEKDTTGYHYTKQLSPQAIYNRQLLNIPLYQYSDVPVNQSYIQELSFRNISIVCKSKWLNAVTARLTAEQVNQVKQLPFVQSVEKVTIELLPTSTSNDSLEYDPEYIHIALSQMKFRAFAEQKLYGDGVVIGVIDAGFFNAYAEASLTQLQLKKSVLMQRDFIDKERTDIITQAATNSDGHGMMVLKSIAGYDTTKKYQIGLAPNAKFVLARTENGNKEHRAEEDQWIMAMEWMDSLGVRLISTSLGYAIKMDDPNDNYTQDQMDGNTARISKAAQIAFDQKGIFLVVSAGNEGGNPEWRIISAPADAKGVLSVGATQENHWMKINYSSIGPESLPYLKPNVSCFSPNGTSFSCPSIAGFVACLMQKNPSLTNVQLYDLVQKSGHLYPYGNNYLGYGVPQADWALEMMAFPEKELGNRFEVIQTKSKYKISLDDKDANVEFVVFHKSDKRTVVSQSIVKMKKGKLSLKRPKGCSYSTIVYKNELCIELNWLQ